MNNIVRMPQQGQLWNPQTQTWCGDPCNPCDSVNPTPPFPCPPPGFPPPGCPPWYSGINSPPWYPGANAGVSFGTQPPPNPTRGHFWWDGSVLWMFDGAAWVATGGGGGSQGAASVAIGTSPPTQPQPGALWFDGAMLLLWNGAAWIPTEGNATGTTPPANPSDGTLWWNGSQLQVWDGNAWVPVSSTKSYIQSTAPTAPNPGDTWWNGTVMYIWDGTKWNTVGPGASVGSSPTSQIVFALPQAAAMSVPTAWTILPYNDTPQVYNTNFCSWDPVQKRLTASKPGLWAFQARGAASAGGCGLAILKNPTSSFTNAGSADIIVNIQSSSTGGWLNSTGFAQMNGTSDFVQVYGWAQGGFQGTGTNPVFSAAIFA